jgi:hypothetical protein
VWHWKQADLVFVSVVGGVLSFGLVKIGIGAEGFVGLGLAGSAYALAVGGYLFHAELLGWLGKKA